MALDPLQRGLIETMLGVQPRRKGLHIASKGEKLDKKIGGALDDYTRREDKVLEAIRDLAAIPATAPMVAELEGKVSAIRSRVETTVRDDAAADIKQAYKDLDAVKDEARATALTAGDNSGFYSMLDFGERELDTLEGEPRFDLVQDRAPAIRGKLKDARDAARIGSFDTAQQHLDEANTATLKAAQVVNQYGRDLVAFDRDALAFEQALKALEDGPHFGLVQDRVPAMRGTLKDARDAALANGFDAARQHLGVANTARLGAAQDVDQFGRDLAAFDADALAFEQGQGALDKHPSKQAGAAETGKAVTLLAEARQQAAGFDMVAARQKLADAGQARADAKVAADAALVADVDAAKLILDAVLTGADPAVANFMAEPIRLVDEKLATARTTVPTDAEAAGKLLGEAKQATLDAGTTRDEALVDITKLRADARKTDGALRLLDAHPQKAHADTEIQAAVNTLAAARMATEDGRIATARLRQQEADDNAADAKSFADQYGAFLVKYADAVRYCRGLKKNFPKGWNAPDLALPEIENAKVKANIQRKYAEAETELTTAVAGMKSGNDNTATILADTYAAHFQDLENSLLAIVPPKQPKTPGADASALDNLDADANAALAEEMGQLRAMRTQVENLGKAGKWEEAAAQNVQLIDLLVATKKVAARREGYNADRALTLTAIQGLKTYKSLVGHMMSLQTLVVRADGLATSKQMRFEDARKQLAEIRATCTSLVGVGKAADTYIKERAEADTALDELEKAA